LLLVAPLESVLDRLLNLSLLIAAQLVAQSLNLYSKHVLRLRVHLKGHDKAP
jgi:hypothetical protein